MFRKFWKENVEKSYTDSAQYAYLLEALPEKVKSRLSSVTRDSREVWDQLESLYGRPEIIGQQVSQELFDLSPKEHGEEYLIKLSTMLEETEVLVTEHDQMEWLTSCMAIRQLEDKLPIKEKIEWAEKMDTYEGSKYEKLKKFLRVKREILEKMKSIGMQSKLKTTLAETPRCTAERCQKKGHEPRDCPAKKKDEKRCWNCSESGHLRDDCPKPSKGRGAGAGGRRGNDRGR